MVDLNTLPLVVYNNLKRGFNGYSYSPPWRSLKIKEEKKEEEIKSCTICTKQNKKKFLRELKQNLDWFSPFKKLDLEENIMVGMSLRFSLKVLWVTYNYICTLYYFQFVCYTPWENVKEFLQYIYNIHWFHFTRNFIYYCKNM